MTRILNILAVVLLAQGPLQVSAEILYFTDFDDFPTGENSWAGSDGWVSNNATPGVVAIDDGLFEGALGKTAALGFSQPGNAFTTVLRQINHDPSGGSSLLRLFAVFGIEDSTVLTNFRRDDFFFSLYNIDGDLLASLRLSNTEAEYGIWKQDGSLQAGGQESYTGQEFIRSELHELEAVIDLAANRWAVTLDGIPLFEDELFNRTGLPLNLGPIAVEWETGTGTTSGYGDNWLLLAEILVETIESEAPPVAIGSVSRDPSGGITLDWSAHAGFDYQVEFSDDLERWSDSLPGSTFVDPGIDRVLTFTDSLAGSSPRRFYRLVRTPRIPAP